MKKLPPFGKPLAELQRQGLRPSNSINLFIGNRAWKKGADFSYSYPTRTLILPPWLAADKYHWPVNQCEILIFDTGYAEKQYVEELVFYLFKDNAEKIYLSSCDHKLTVYKRN